MQDRAILIMRTVELFPFGVLCCFIPEEPEVSWEDRLFHNDAVHVDQLLPGCEADIAAHSQTHGHAGRCALGHETLFLWPKPEHILSPVCSDVANLLPS